MTPQDAIAIRFHNGRAVEIDQAFAYADNYAATDGYASPSEVIWSDGSYSYAKGWWDIRVPSAPLVRVGAGAYGDMTILERAA